MIKHIFAVILVVTTLGGAGYLAYYLLSGDIKEGQDITVYLADGYKLSIEGSGKITYIAASKFPFKLSHNGAELKPWKVTGQPEWFFREYYITEEYTTKDTLTILYGQVTGRKESSIYVHITSDQLVKTTINAVWYEAVIILLLIWGIIFCLLGVILYWMYEKEISYFLVNR